MSNILAQTATSSSPDAGYSTVGTWDRTPPAGFAISCLGLLRSGNEPGTVGMIFAVSTPDGYTLDKGGSGSIYDQNTRTYDKMLFVVLGDGSKGATQNWEIWFNQSDVNSNNWGLPMQLQVSSNGTTTTYTYTFRKGGSSDGHGHRPKP